ncbi:hypothetical protein [Streptomyces sp. NPDC013455]
MPTLPWTMSATPPRGAEVHVFAWQATADELPVSWEEAVRRLT